jgi:enamine deaminase RidA (YjgF/YER057c/UK114 family)
LYSREDSE